MRKKDVENVYTSSKAAIIVHVLGILTFFVAPLLIKNMSKDRYTISNASKALNWQINVIIYFLTGLILTVVFVGYIILPAVLILNVAFSVIAAIKASKNRLWDYPLSFQFLNE